MTDHSRDPGLDPGSRFFLPDSSRSGTPAKACPELRRRGRGDEGFGAAASRLVALTALLALTACGSAAGLAPRAGESLPVAPRGAKATPTPTQLLTPTAQQRPQRGDELLRNSQERRSDDFDLPPPN